MTRFVESMVEEAALEWFRDLGYTLLSGSAAQPTGTDPWRDTLADVVLTDALRSALRRLNPQSTNDTLSDAYRALLAPCSGDLVARNQTVHRMLTKGVEVTRSRLDGTLHTECIRAIDFGAPSNNDWIVVNQFVVSGIRHMLRPDIVVFVNGLPLAVVELKTSAQGGRAPQGAIEQLLAYQKEVPRLFDFNAVLVAADGSSARIGPIGAGADSFKPWRSIAGASLAPGFKPELQVLIEGVFEQPRLLDLLRYFLVFETLDDGRVRKQVPAYFQFDAVRVALSETRRAMAPADSSAPHEQDTLSAGPGVQRHGGRPGDHRIGVIWHATGSGRGLTTCLFVKRLLEDPRFPNTTVVILSDRSIIDEQLQAQLHSLVEKSLPILAPTNRQELRSLLSHMGRGVLFSTLHKFLSPHDELIQSVISARHDIVVIANDAYRSHLGSMGRAVQEALPNASFIGFTGVPLHLKERGAQMIFGDYISIYDTARAVEDGMAVPIYYEARHLPPAGLHIQAPDLDAAFDAALEAESLEGRAHRSRLEELLTGSAYLEVLASDIVGHFEKRWQSGGGKALVACVSRGMSIALYREILRLRPAWRGEAGSTGVAAVVISQHPSDPPDWHSIIGGQEDEFGLARRFIDPADKLSLAIVCDKWLTGFDAPVLSTLYLCKPMRGHVLLQAISRLTRPFPGKHGALVVDYLGLGKELREALTASPAGETGEKIPVDLVLAIADMQEKHRTCVALMRGFDRSAWASAAFEQRQRMLAPAQNHVLAQKQGKERLQRAAMQLWRAFTLVVPHAEADQIREDVGFFLALAVSLDARVPHERMAAKEPERELIEFLTGVIDFKAVTDLFLATGLEAPNGDGLEEAVLLQVQRMPLPYLAIDVIRRLIRNELQQRSRRNLALARAFARELDWIALRYDERHLGAGDTLAELIALAYKVRSSRFRAAEIGMPEDQLAYYDAISLEGGAAGTLAPETLQAIAAQIGHVVRSRLKAEWVPTDSARRRLRAEIRNVLRNHKYPPDAIDRAVRGAMEQAEVFAEQLNVLTA